MAANSGGRGPRYGQDSLVETNEVRDVRRRLGELLKSIQSITADSVLRVINVKDAPYKAKGDGVTDDTAAIQAAINAAAAAGAELYLPPPATGAYYKFSKLTIPTGHTNIFRMFGSGPATDYDAATPASYHCTTLVSTDATGPAITFDGGAGYTTRGTIIEGMTIIAGNSTSVISLTNANTNTALKRLMVHQTGSGCGIDWTTTWFATLEDVLVQSGSSSITSGSVGLRIKNIVDGGIVNVTRCTVQRYSGATGGFDIGMQLGALATDSSTWKHHIDAVTLVSCTAQHCNTGLALGYGTRGATVIGQHIEFCNTQGIWITNIAGPLSILGGFSYNPAATVADVTIDGDATSNDQNALSFIGHDFRAVNLYGFDWKNAAYTSGTVKNCRFNLYTAGATAFRTRSADTPWILEANVIGAGMTAYDDSTVIRMIVNHATGGIASRGGMYAPTAAGTFKGLTVGTDGVNVNSGAAVLYSTGTVAGSVLRLGGHYVAFDAAAPTTGTWGVGDKCFNTAAAVGSPKGWVCTVAGTPGTWVSEGNL